MIRTRWPLVLALALPLATCDDGGPDTALVARAAGHELTVAEAAGLLASASQLPNQRDVAMALAELWVDYTLLGTAAAEDSTLAQVDVTPLVQAQVEQGMILALRDSVIQVDSAGEGSPLPERLAQAESAFVAGVEERAAPRITDGAVEIVRAMARNPRARLTGRAGDRALVEYQGGALTVDEVREFMQSRPPQFRSQVAAAEDEPIEAGILRALTQRELLVAEAERRSFIVPQSERPPMSEAARRTFREAARQVGLLPVVPEPGQERDEAVAQAVDELLRGMIRNERDVVPLGAIGAILHDQYPSEIFEGGVARVPARVDEVRASGGAPQDTPPGDTPPGGS